MVNQGDTSNSYTLYLVNVFHTEIAVANVTAHYKKNDINVKKVLKEVSAWM